MNSIQEWISYVSKNCALIKKGSGRHVYNYKGNMVVKIPNSFIYNINNIKESFNRLNTPEQNGLLQNIVEFNVYQNCPSNYRNLLCPIVDHFFIKETPIIFMKKLNLFTTKDENRFREYYYRTKLMAVFRERSLKNYIETEKGILALGEYFSLEIKELLHTCSNWGYNEEGVKLIDYGFLRRDKRIEVMQKGLGVLK